jgi:hypothetical protein
VEESPRPAPSSGSILIVSGVIVVLWVIALVVMLGRSTYDYWGALLIAPVLFAASIPMMSRQARRENDGRVFWLFFLGLIAKFVFTLIRYYISFDLYNKADARGFYRAGAAISRRFLSGNFSPQLKGPLTDTNFIKFFTGIVFTITRPTLLGGFFIFTWLAFLGAYCFYRAYVIAVPEGRQRTYAALLLFLPSILYWPASIGKDAWLMFALGVATLGAAKIIAERLRSGLLLCALGLAGAAVVRPHVALGIAVGLAGAYVVRRQSRERARELAAFAKILSLVIPFAGVAILTILTFRYIGHRGLSTQSGIGTILQQTQSASAGGGSSFSASLPTTPLGAVKAAFTVLFRPLVIEATNIQTLASAVEGSFLILLVLIRIRWVLAALRSIRRQPFVMVAIGYLLVSIAALSTISNFGILTRQRTLLFPLFFVLLTIPPPPRGAGKRSARVTDEPAASEEPREPSRQFVS